MDGSRLTRQEASYWLAHEHNLTQRCRHGEVLFAVGFANFSSAMLAIADKHGEGNVSFQVAQVDIVHSGWPPYRRASYRVLLGRLSGLAPPQNSRCHTGDPLYRRHRMAVR